MLFHLNPTTGVRWNDLPESFVDELSLEQRQQLKFHNFDWKVSELPLTPLVLALALRFGWRTETGIVVPGTAYSEFYRQAQITKSSTELQNMEPAIRARDEAFDRLAPGWLAAGEKLNEAVADATTETLREIEASLLAQLETPIDEQLVEHWESLSGTPTSV